MDDFWTVCPYSFTGAEVRSRKRELVWWRNVGMVWGFMSGLTLDQSGQLFDRHHGVVLHAFQSIENAYEGFGHTEMIEIIELIKANQAIGAPRTKDIWQNYAVCQVLMDKRIALLIN